MDRKRIIIIFTISIFIGGSLSGCLSESYDLTIKVENTDYEGFVQVYLDDEQLFNGWVNERETIVKTYSVSSGKHTIAITQGVFVKDTKIINVHSDKTIIFHI